MKTIINTIFGNVQYWKDKKLLLQAIHPDHFNNKRVIIQLLGISSGNVSPENQAKKDMWNYQVREHNLGDDILELTNPKILEDFEFAKRAIEKYNRTYIFIGKKLKASRELALTAAMYEKGLDESKYHAPILEHMTESFRLDHEISLMATTRNIENLRFATNLKRNKYFIIDLMNLLFETSLKQKVLRYIDRSLLSDKRFVSKLGCFDNLCENFHSDVEYVSNAVRYDINILKKTQMFDQTILKAALNTKSKDIDRQDILAEVFRYIERFNDDYDELDSKIKDKKILKNLFWEFGETVSEEFI